MRSAPPAARKSSARCVFWRPRSLMARSFCTAIALPCAPNAADASSIARLSSATMAVRLSVSSVRIRSISARVRRSRSAAAVSARVTASRTAVSVRSAADAISVRRSVLTLRMSVSICVFAASSIDEACCADSVAARDCSLAILCMVSVIPLWSVARLSLIELKYSACFASSSSRASPYCVPSDEMARSRLCTAVAMPSATAFAAFCIWPASPLTSTRC